MSKESRKRAPNRVSLTPQTVVEGALSLADSEGLGAVTIRRLAKELGVTPMALYWHFRLSEGVEPDAYFAFGLDLLLAGIEAMAARERRGLGP